MNFDLRLKQGLTQKITVDTIQHLEVLQLSEEALSMHILEKVYENPLLEIVTQDNKAIDGVIEMSLIQKFDLSYKMSNNTQGFDFSITKSKEGIEAFLIEQIPLDKSINKNDYNILKYLIRHLDEHYYLNINTENVARIFQVDEQVIKKLIRVLQTFEPIGIGAKDFREYLLINIKHEPYFHELAYKIVEEHLNLVADFSVKKLAKIYKVSVDQVMGAIEYIKRLKPPLVEKGGYSKEFIIPDVEVKKVSNEWIIEMLNPLRPTIRLNEEYIGLLKANSEHEAYYKDRLKDAMLLMQGIEQRDKTLYKIMRVLLWEQLSFFETQQLSSLKPLTLKAVATKIEVHESTVSRAIRHKYVKIAHTIYALKDLFVKGIVSNSGEVDSVQSIKTRIQELIKQEDKKTPYSDQKLSELLRNEGYSLSRRTVAKYREELNILNSSKRLYF